MIRAGVRVDLKIGGEENFECGIAEQNRTMIPKCLSKKNYLAFLKENDAHFDEK